MVADTKSFFSVAKEDYKIFYFNKVHKFKPNILKKSDDSWCSK
jgi:hypothetical protein